MTRQEALVLVGEEYGRWGYGADGKRGGPPKAPVELEIALRLVGFEPSMHRAESADMVDRQTPA